MGLHIYEGFKRTRSFLFTVKKYCDCGATRKVAKKLKFPRNEEGEQEKDMEGKATEGKEVREEERERRRERIGMEWGSILGKEKKVCKKKSKGLVCSQEGKKF